MPKSAAVSAAKTPPGQSKEESLSPGTDRTLAILEVLSKHPEGLTLAEMVRTLELPQNSVFRITTTLHERGYVQRRENDKRYVLTHKLFDLVRPRVADKSLVVCSYEALKGLRDVTGETTQLFAMSGRKGVVLEQVSGRHPVQVMGEVGLQVPLYSCAPGKALLAWLPEEEFSGWLGQVTLKRFTPTTLATEKALREDLEATRKRGFSVDRAEGLEGIHCVAAPVLNAFEYPVAALTVMAPAFRLPEEDFDKWGEQVTQFAGEVRRRLLE